MDDASIILAISRFGEDFGTWPKIGPQYYTSKARSCANWAIEELLQRIYDETDKLPVYISGLEQKPIIDIVKDFIWEMDCYYEECDNEENALLFAIARDTVNDVLYLF